METKSIRVSPGAGWLTAALLAVLLVIFFHGAFKPGHTVFSNDGPLGPLVSESRRLPEAFSGSWEDLNSLGFRGAGQGLGISNGLRLALGPVLFSKLYAPTALLILGLGAYVFFRRLGLASTACVLGSLAAALNSGFFTAMACWGVAGQAIMVGFAFLALAGFVGGAGRNRWGGLILGGAALGVAVVEGADIGALFSMVVALFLIYQAYQSHGVSARGATAALGRLSVVVLASAFVAFHSMYGLIGTQIQGVAGVGQQERSREERWDWATQWSLPKREALGFAVPGLFGYRMDSPDGANYWGAVGRDPNWDRYFAAGAQGPGPGGALRFSGGAVYAGILVVLVACWSVLQSLRKENSVFSLENRRWIWFWAAVAFVSLLLSFGRFAPFYQFLYALPYFSTIRNPAKFTHIVNWSVVILFAYGIHGLWRCYVEKPAGPGFKAWWAKAGVFDRRYVFGLGVVLAVATGAWLIFAKSRPEFSRYLAQVGFDPNLAELIATFSVRQAGLFLPLLAIASALIVFTLSGGFGGARARLAPVLFGLFIVADLGRANAPFVVIWDYQDKYATNPILERLRQKPYEGRVAILPEWFSQILRLPPELGLANELYRIEWAQHHFQYYDIQSLDVVQMSRPPEDLVSFEAAFTMRESTNVQQLLEQIQRKLPRRWELTNTRYLVGPAVLLPFLNEQVDPQGKRFRMAEQFAIVAKPGVSAPRSTQDLTAVVSTNGSFALFEFTGALPRAQLFGNWRSITNGAAALELLSSPSFDPHGTVVVMEELPAASGTANTNAGSVEFASYSPTDIRLKAEALAPAVLLLNDRYDPNWSVYVDGVRAPLLRANYLMRGVYLQPGRHEVRFRFEPPAKTLYVSLAAILAAMAVAGVLWLGSRKDAAPADGKKP